MDKRFIAFFIFLLFMGSCVSIQTIRKNYVLSHPELSLDQKNAIFRGNITIGMSLDAVIVVLGQPYKTVEKETATTDTQVFSFKDWERGAGNFIKATLINGKVVIIERTYEEPLLRPVVTRRPDLMRMDYDTLVIRHPELGYIIYDLKGKHEELDNLQEQLKLSIAQKKTMEKSQAQELAKQTKRSKPQSKPAKKLTHDEETAEMKIKYPDIAAIYDRIEVLNTDVRNLQIQLKEKLKGKP
jgi:hypothetical protein